MKSCQDSLEGESKTLENKLKAIQKRYEARFQSQEEIIQRLTIENTEYRHKNELFKIDISDLEFRLKRFENNNKLVEAPKELELLPMKILEDRIKSMNDEYNSLLNSVDMYSAKIDSLSNDIITLTNDKKDSLTLIERKRMKINNAEERIRLLENKIQEKKCKYNYKITFSGI